MTDFLNGTDMPVVYSRTSQLPKKADQIELIREENYNPLSFPSSSSTYNKKKMIHSMESQLLFFDGQNNVFSEGTEERITSTPVSTEKALYEENLYALRPSNSFISARSMLKKHFMRKNISTMQYSRLMSEVS